MVLWDALIILQHKLLLLTDTFVSFPGQSQVECGESRNKEFVEKMARYRLQVERADESKASAETEELQQREALKALEVELEAAQTQMGAVQNG